MSESVENVKYTLGTVGTNIRLGLDRIANYEAEVSKNVSSIAMKLDVINGTIAAKGDAVAEKLGVLSSLSDNVAKIDGDIKTIATKLDGLTSKVGDVVSATSSLDADLKDALSSLKEEIENLRGEMTTMRLALVGAINGLLSPDFDLASVDLTRYELVSPKGLIYHSANDVACFPDSVILRGYDYSSYAGLPERNLSNSWCNDETIINITIKRSSTGLPIAPFLIKGDADLILIKGRIRVLKKNEEAGDVPIAWHMYLYNSSNNEISPFAGAMIPINDDGTFAGVFSTRQCSGGCVVGITPLDPTVSTYPFNTIFYEVRVWLFKEK